MLVIYKYPLQVFGFDYGVIDVPEGDVLKIDFQCGVVHAWICHEEDEVARMQLRLIPTGQPFNDEDMLFVGTAVSDQFCWHVFRAY